MSKQPQPQTTPEEKVATALNEQGFLLAQAVRDRIKFGRGGGVQQVTAWRYRVAALPDLIALFGPTTMPLTV